MHNVKQTNPINQVPKDPLQPGSVPTGSWKPLMLEAERGAYKRMLYQRRTLLFRALGRGWVCVIMNFLACQKKNKNKNKTTNKKNPKGARKS